MVKYIINSGDKITHNMLELAVNLKHYKIAKYLLNFLHESVKMEEEDDEIDYYEDSLDYNDHIDYDEWGGENHKMID